MNFTQNQVKYFDFEQVQNMERVKEMFPLHMLADENKDSEEETTKLQEIINRTGKGLLEDYTKNSLINLISDGGN